MTGVAILGYGVVGSGTARLLTSGAEGMRLRTGTEPRLRRIVDIRSFPGDPLEPLITPAIDDVLVDPEIRVVVETIGGVGIAYEYTKKALMSGRHVVTSNKELVACHGPELMELATENGVRYLFEASVGGGIPIIHPLRVCLAANVLNGISGILNGTTNYILTRMEQADIPFETALAEAQSHGFAESRPEADIQGLDACRKLAILSSIAFGGYVRFQDIHTEGIERVDADRIATAAIADAQVKLLAKSVRMPCGRIAASVMPTALSRRHPASCASGVFNAIAVDGDAIGTAMFYGPGAGAMPTASAVVSDVLECLGRDGPDPRDCWPALPEGSMMPFEEHSVQILLRLPPDGSSPLRAALEAEGVSCRSIGSDGVLLFGEDETLTEGLLAEVIRNMDGEGAAPCWIRYVGAAG